MQYWGSMCFSLWCVCAAWRARHAAHTHHDLKHMLPQYCMNYNDVFLLIVFTKK